MKHQHTKLVSAFAAASMVVGLSACGDDEKETGTVTKKTTIVVAKPDVTGEVTMTGVWSGEEQKNFQKVLDAFEAKYPGVKVKYTSAGDETATKLSTAVEGGNPPDVAAIAQPGLVKEFEAKGALKPIAYAKDTIGVQYPEDFVKLGTIKTALYSFVFKAANKSTVWYNVKAFEDAGVEAPKTWEEFIANSKTIGESGTPAYSIGGADGWTLTDLFENIYLRQAGPEKYDQLTEHTIPWTDESVKTALKAMADVLGDKDNLVGGTDGALQTDFPKSVENVFVDPAKGAQIIEGDFVPGVVKSKLEPVTGYNQFAFPSIGDSGNAIVGGGDSIVTFNDTPAVQALVEYLASKDAQEVRAALGGFSSANNAVDPAVYPDELTRATAIAIAKADTFRFDMSDLSPAAFGGTPGQGSWKGLQDFLENPTDVDGAAEALEKAAAKAYKDQ